MDWHMPRGSKEHIGPIDPDAATLNQTLNSCCSAIVDALGRKHQLKPSIHAFTDTLAVRSDGGELVNRTDQANVVVMNDVALHQTARIVHLTVAHRAGCTRF